MLLLNTKQEWFQPERCLGLLIHTFLAEHDLAVRDLCLPPCRLDACILGALSASETKQKTAEVNRASGLEITC